MLAEYTGAVVILAVATIFAGLVMVPKWNAMPPKTV